MNRFLLAPAAARGDANRDVELTPVPQLVIDSIEGIIPDMNGDIGGALGALGVFSQFLTKVPERKLGWAGRDVAEAAYGFEEAILKAMDAKPTAWQLLGRVFEYSVRLASINAVSRAGAAAVVTMDDLHFGAAWALESARTMIEQAGALMARNDHESDLNAVTATIKEAKTIRQSDLLRDKRTRHIPARDLAGITDKLKLSELIEEFDAPPRTGAKPGGRPAKIFRWVA